MGKVISENQLEENLIKNLSDKGYEVVNIKNEMKMQQNKLF